MAKHRRHRSKHLRGPLLLFSFATGAWLAGELFGPSLYGAERHAVQPRAVTICRDAVVLTRATDPLGRMAACAAATPASPRFGIRRASGLVRG